MRLETFEVFKNSDAYYDRKPSAIFRGSMVTHQAIKIQTQYGKQIAFIYACVIKLLFNQGYVVIFQIKENARLMYKNESYLKSRPWMLAWSESPKYSEPRTEWFKKFNNLEEAMTEFENFILNEIKIHQSRKS